MYIMIVIRVIDYRKVVNVLLRTLSYYISFSMMASIHSARSILVTFSNQLDTKSYQINAYWTHNTRYISNIRYCPKEQWSKIISQKIIILVLIFRGEIVFLKKIALFLNSVV